MADNSPDTAPANADTPPENQEAQLARKVELDLDDAPFLMPEPEAPPIEEKAPSPQGRDEAKKQDDPTAPSPVPLYRKKLFLAALGGGFLLVIAVIILIVSLRGAPPPPPPPPAADLPPPASSTQQPQAVQEGDGERFLVNMAPFVILLDSPDGSRFLTFKFSVYADDSATQYAMQLHDQRLRNVIYDFLRNHSVEELTASGSVNTLKTSLRSTMANELPDSRVGEIFIEQIQLQ